MIESFKHRGQRTVKIVHTLLWSFVVSGITIVSSGCDEKENGQVASKPQSDSITIGNLSLGVQDKNYSFVVVNESITSQKINGEITSTESRMELGVNYNVAKDTSGGYNFIMKYDKVNVMLKAMDVERNVDAALAARSSHPLERTFDAFNTGTIHVKADENMNIREIKGWQELTDKMKNLANGDPETIQVLNTSLKQFASPQSLKETFEKMFKPLAGKSFKVGDTWTVSMPISPDINTQADNIFIVSSIDDEFVTIKSQSVLLLENQPTIIDGISVNASFDGTQQGELRVERSTGMLYSSNTNLEIEGKLSVLGTQVPINIKMRNVAKRVKEDK